VSCRISWVLASDERVRRQLETFLANPATLISGSRPSKAAKEFEALYFRPKTPAPDAVEAPSEEGPVDMRLFSSLNIVIFGPRCAHRKGSGLGTRDASEAQG